MQKKIRYRSICGVFKVIIEWSYNTNILLRVHEEKFKTEPVAHIPHKTGLLKPGLHYKTIREDGQDCAWLTKTPLTLMIQSWTVFQLAITRPRTDPDIRKFRGFVDLMTGSRFVASGYPDFGYPSKYSIIRGYPDPDQDS